MLLLVLLFFDGGQLHDGVGRVGLRRVSVGDLLVRAAALLRHEPRRGGALPAGRPGAGTAPVRLLRHLRPHAHLLEVLGRSVATFTSLGVLTVAFHC